MTLRRFLIPTTFALALAVSAAPAAAQRRGGGAGHMGGGHEGRSPSGTHAGGWSHDHSGFDRGRVVRQDFARRGFEGRFLQTRIIRPFPGPFFAFRPRFALGFGFFAGWPVPYPWDYVDVYPYPYAYPYPYVAPDGTTYNDGEPVESPAPSADQSSALSDQQRNYGGISFDVTPSDATVIVDGMKIGQAMNFSPSSAPLTLTPGRHRVVIEREGYRTMTFDSEVVVGQVIPYQGTLQPE
jgi:PEGA domain-containing protein